MSTTAPEAAKKMPAGANAPYKIIPMGDKFVVKNNAGETKATFDKRAAAVDYLQALYANVPGAQKRAGKVKFTGKAKNRAPKEKADLEQYVMECVGLECERSFIDESAFQTHVGTVHPEIMAKVAEEARDFKAATRKTAAKKGQAMGDGSFPIKTGEDLKNAIRLCSKAKDPAAAKAHIIKRAKAMGMTNMLPKSWVSDGADLAYEGRIECPECPRMFRHEDAFIEHAEAVHTFDDIRMIVQEAIGEKYANRDGDTQNRIYTYVADLADDWVVFEASQGNQSDTYKCAYSVVDNVATLGDITEVRRRTVWEPVGSNEPTGILPTAKDN